jgi:hypothetical protein
VHQTTKIFIYKFQWFSMSLKTILNNHKYCKIT